MILLAGVHLLSKILSYILILVSSFNDVYSFKLSAPSVLLPYNKGIPSNFTLEVTGVEREDCFEWHSDNPQIVRVTPVFSQSLGKNSNCSRKAILSSVADLTERAVTEISVLGGGKKLHCHVITDIVRRIELEWLTDELILGGLPQKVSVIAKDNQGHKFTSISGLEIKWSTKSVLDDSAESSEDDEVIRISKFDVSEYGLQGEATELEERGLYSSSVLIHPVKLGTGVISATMLFSGVPVLESEDLKLKVVQNLKIYPTSPLYLLRHTSFKVKLDKHKREGEKINIENFSVDIGEPSVISQSNDLSNDSLVYHAKEYGISSIKFTNQDYGMAKLDVNVVKLARVGFHISHGGYNILQEMKIYEVFLDLYDENENKIYAADDMRFSVSFPAKLFHVIYTSSNGTYAVVQTIAPGHGKIRAEFKGVVLEDDSITKESSISSSLDVKICQKISIFPPITLLPVLPKKPMHTIPLTVAGGTGNYVWSLSNNTAARIIPDTEKKNVFQLEIYEEIHHLIVTMTDSSNINFIGHAEVSVQTPLDIETYPSVTEAEVGNVLIVPAALLGYENKEKDIVKKFDDCSKADIKVDIVEKYVLAYEQEANIPAFGKGCKSLQFKCRMPGYSRINLEYTVGTRQNNVTFKTTTLLSCYKTLKPVHPVRVAVLALGSSMDVAFEGGPRKWPLLKENHYTKLDANDPEKVNIQLIKDPIRYNKDLTVFRVVCKALGENTLTLKVGNEPSATLKHPAKSEASIKFICSEPHSLHLKLHKKSSKKKLKDENIVKVPFYGEKTFSVDVYVKDEKGRRFANISSLRVAWDTSDKTLAYPDKAFDFESYENAVSGYRKLTRNFNEFKMRGGTGDLKVEAKVTSYRKDVLTKEGIEEYKEIGEISNSIDLKLVSLRDINAGLYDAAEEIQDQDGHCEKDSCET